jgi:hypothetical protein
VEMLWNMVLAMGDAVGEVGGLEPRSRPCFRCRLNSLVIRISIVRDSSVAGGMVGDEDECSDSRFLSASSQRSRQRLTSFLSSRL